MARDEDENKIDIGRFDRRVVERNIKKGLITRKDYERHLKSLPDGRAKAILSDERPDAPGADDE